MSVSTGVVVCELRQLAEMRAAVDLLVAIWGRGIDGAPVSSDLLRAMSHSGSYVCGAELDGQLVGVSVGFVGIAPDGGFVLHSHISGVRPDAQDRGVGFALKQHQRAWAKERGLKATEWTFDPLVRRNAWFNLAKLGATIVGYEPNFYGAMGDGINAGDESDRCLVRWDVDDPRGRREDEATLLADGAVLFLDEEDGKPRRADAPSDAAVLLCRVPADAVAVRAANRVVGRQWRLALRATLGEALEDGYEADGMTPTGCYVLRRR